MEQWGVSSTDINHSAFTNISENKQSINSKSKQKLAKYPCIIQLRHTFLQFQSKKTPLHKTKNKRTLLLPTAMYMGTYSINNNLKVVSIESELIRKGMH